MNNLYQSLLLIIAGATKSELAAQLKNLKIENQILRSKVPGRVPLTLREKNKLIRFGSKLGKALCGLVTIVHPDTMRRWIRESRSATGRTKPASKGRPRTKIAIRDLIIRLARENHWGYTRIIGELKKLGISPPSRNTVKNILKEYGLEPGPQRGPGTWDEFLRIHAATLWQCDFFSKKVVTLTGFRELFVLVFLHVGTRRVFVTAPTRHPNEAWVQQQAHSFLEHIRGTGLGAKIVMHDRDTKFTASFDQILEMAESRVMMTAFRSPNTNAFVERFIQTLQQECLDHFLVFGERHLDYLVKEMVAHYHDERPHQALGNLPPSAPETSKLPGQSPEATIPTDIPMTAIKCRSRLGGLLNHYFRIAA